MSDTFAVCPECSEYNAHFIALPEEEKTFDGKYLLQCQKCKAIVREDEVIYDHIEYWEEREQKEEEHLESWSQ